VKPGCLIQVVCKCLDTYVKEGNPGPDFILMDVEHAEGRVLRGMSKTMETYRPLIVLETHGSEAIEETCVELENTSTNLRRSPI